MKLDFTADYDWEARIDRIKSHYARNAEDFIHRSYGSEVTTVSLLFMCRDPSIKFKRRVRFSSKSAEFYTDVMLDLPIIVPLSMKEKMHYVSRELLQQLSEQLNKRKFKDFDHARFLNDLEKWLEGIEGRYDGQTSGPWRYASGEEVEQ
ncbi:MULTISPECIES: hypothetical protein [Xanthomonas]|uniref:hypothetical protein n=1 Tax=Xanthomonas TaxID=338 RepID=UPI0012630B30|nr:MULTISPECIES: hypothetical protein [Xanthomonas]MCW0457418.1 hypothetical protein [Xanthomonas sacchari]